MTTQDAYNQWASTYDDVANKTRDLELKAGQTILANADFTKLLEIGCGTGKNTLWLSEKTNDLTAVDFSEAMMDIARKKINTGNVTFQQADITRTWNFKKATLITCSLILEHIENIDFVLQQADNCLENGGCFYICELHPYKQLEGSRAKFETNDSLVQLEYFIHHISDYFTAAQKAGLTCIDIKEWFDDNDRSTTPRLVSFLFQKIKNI